MKVVLLTRDLPRVAGGISTHAEALLKGLRRLGVEVDVCIGRTDSGTLLLPRRISLRRYDLVHVLSAPYGALVFGIPMVVTVHAPIVDEWSYYAGESRLAALPGYVFERVTLRRASSILAVSQATKASLMKRYRISESKISVVGNGIDFDRFHRVGQEERIPNRILMVSRLEPRKNIPEAFLAFSHLPQGSYQAQVVGDGSQLGSLKSMAEKMMLNVAFLGRIDGLVVPDVYNRAGIFLATSRSEGFGLSLLEAMASNCAVIASDIPAHRELVVDGQSGLLYHSQNELVERILMLLSDEKLRARLALGGTTTARKLSWEKVARNVFAAYREVLLTRNERQN